MNKLILIGIFMLSTSLFSQSVFFTTGKNYTDYDFTTSEKNQDSEFASGSGNFYEVGYTRSINRNNTFRYSISINLNEYNSYGGDLATSYAWETDYIGLKNNLDFDLINISDKFKISLNGGFTIQTLINGQQRINGLSYDLMEYEDFKGVFTNVGFGGSLFYGVSSNIGVAAGYDFSKSFSMTKTDSGQFLNFTNNQIYFKLIISKK